MIGQQHCASQCMLMLLLVFLQSLIMSPSWPISIIHRIHSSSTLTLLFLLPYLPSLICRQVLVCWYWQGNGETGCELTTEQHGYTCKCKHKTLKWKTKRKWGSGGAETETLWGWQTGNTTKDNFSISGIPSRGCRHWAHEAIDAANWLFLGFPTKQVTRSKGKERKTGADFFLRAFLLLHGHYDQVEPVNNLEDLMDAPVQCVFQGGSRP